MFLKLSLKATIKMILSKLFFSLSNSLSMFTSKAVRSSKKNAIYQVIFFSYISVIKNVCVEK